MTKLGKDVQGPGAANASTGRLDTKLTLVKRRAVETMIVFVLACLVSVGWLAWRNMHAQIASEELETHSRIVMQQWSDLLSRLKDAETGQRGFIITGKEEFLEPYNASFDASITQLADLRRLTADNPTHQQRLAALTPLVAAKLANLKENIVLRETQDFTAAHQSVMTRSGENIMGQIRVLVGQSQAEEQRLLNERAAISKTNTRKTIQSVFFSGALGGLALLLLVSFLRWELRGRRRAEAAVDASEVQYRTLFNSIDEGFCILEINFDQDGQPVDYLFHETNPAFEKQTGVADATGKRISEIAPGQKSEGIEIYAKVLQTGEPAHFVKESTAFNRWFDVYAFRLDGSQSARVAVLFSNITERKQAELLLRQNHDTFFNLIQSAPFGLYIVDAQFCLRQVSTASLKVFSNIDPLIGRDFEEIMRLLWPHSFASEALARFRHTLLTGEPYAAKNTTEQRHNIPAVESYDWKIERITLPDGQFGVVCYFYDITQRMLDEKALRDSEQRFRALFDRGPVAMYSCDTSGTILEFNPCAVNLWGRKPTLDDVGERFYGVSRVYRPDGALLTAAQNPMIAVLKGEIAQANEVEAVLERPDGSRITVIANIVPLKDGQGKITGAINCFHDITERSRLERQTRDQAQALAELHRRKDEFLAMLSHELRNPMAPLTSAVELLRRQVSQDPVHSQACRIIERQVGQMKHLVDDLLEVSRITSGNVRLRKELVSVGDIVERSLETAQPLILQRQQLLTVSLPPHPVWLNADATRLEQVLVNLLNNAAKYTDMGGRLWLSVGQEGDVGSKAGSSVAVIKVRDTGIGIAAELLPHVFDLFTQAERAIDRSQGGMGIGLSLVRQLVVLHEGTVEAHSILGHGSEFTVRLPVKQAAVPPLSVPLPLAKPDRLTSKRCRVLAVDDSVDAVESMAMLLRLSGHEVQTAYDGASVLQTALAMRPDVVLLDIGLPGLTGYEVARLIRQEPRLKNAVLVALTGYGRESDRQRSKNAGFDYHLVKPAGVREVEKILATVGEQFALQTAPDQAVAPEV